MKDWEHWLWRTDATRSSTWHYDKQGATVEARKYMAGSFLKASAEVVGVFGLFVLGLVAVTATGVPLTGALLALKAASPILQACFVAYLTGSILQGMVRARASFETGEAGAGTGYLFASIAKQTLRPWAIRMWSPTPAI